MLKLLNYNSEHYIPEYAPNLCMVLQHKGDIRRPTSKRTSSKKSPLFTLWRCSHKKSIWNKITITRFLIHNCPQFFLANNAYKHSSQEKLVLKFLEHAAHMPNNQISACYMHKSRTFSNGDFQ